MQTSPIISVIIPTFNSGSFLLTAIQSVIDQAIRDVEIIVVDDGSTDGTDEILQKSKYGHEISYFKQANQGPASARNLGLEHASGEYVFFLDSDDYLLPDILAIQSSFLDQHPQVGVVYSNGYRVGKRLFNRRIKVPMLVTGDVRKDPSADMIDLLIPRNCFPIDVAMVRRSVFRVISGFDQSLSACEDWDMWLRIASQYPVGRVPIPLANYRVHATSKIGREDAQVFLYGNLRAIERAAIREPARLGPLKNRRMANCYAQVAGIYAQKQKWVEARKMYVQAMRISPGLVKIYPGWVACVFGGKLWHAAYNLRRQLFWHR